jgi:SAM-dependent methyltransferase
LLSYYNRLSSEFYDLDKPVGHSFGDIEFYLERLEGCSGRILEPATGTGRILIPLLEKGLQVDGFDSSAEMMSICRANCEERDLHPLLFEAEMESFEVDAKYDAIIIPAGTFLLLHQREDSIQALKNFYNHIAHDGRLIVDLFLQTEVSIGETSTRTWECPNGDVITLENKVVEIDHIHQYTISHGRYEKWRQGTLLQTELERFPLRWYGVEEFKLMLEEIGFQNIVISSDYNYGQYPEAPRKAITFEAVANKNSDQ